MSGRHKGLGFLTHRRLVIEEEDSKKASVLGDGGGKEAFKSQQSWMVTRLGMIVGRRQ